MIILILLLFNVVFSKLFRVNEWQNVPITGTDYENSLIDVHLFATCEKFSIFFMTELSESTRLEFSYDDVTLKKIDVQSVENAVHIPESPKMLGTCRENNRKILRIKISVDNDTISFKLDDQLIRRPFDTSLNHIKVLIPQSVACCLIRALFLSNSDLDAYTAVSNRFFTSSKYSKRILEALNFTPSPPAFNSAVVTLSETTTSNDTNKWSKFTLGRNPTVINSTTKPKPETSWTHAVNREWSITFVLCSIVVCIIMLSLVIFGTFTVFYLMTKPRGGKSPYAIDA